MLPIDSEAPCTEEGGPAGPVPRCANAYPANTNAASLSGKFLRLRPLILFLLPAQNVIFAAICPFRWPLALVIFPKVVGLDREVAGFPNLVRFNALNASNRMSRPTRSEIFVFLTNPRSSL